MQSTLQLAYFAGHVMKVWFSQAHVLFGINTSCAEESFFFPTAEKLYSKGKSFKKIATFV